MCKTVHVLSPKNAHRFYLLLKNGGIWGYFREFGTHLKSTFLAKNVLPHFGRMFCCAISNFHKKLILRIINRNNNNNNQRTAIHIS